MAPAELAAAATVGATVAKESWNCFKPHFDYVNDLDDNYKKLESEYRSFSAAKTDFYEKIRRTKAMTPTATCHHLLGNVRSTEVKFQDLEAKYLKAKNTRCLWGMCPFCKLRKLGKQIVETKVEVVNEKNEMETLVKEGRVMTERGLEQVATDICDLDALTKNVHELLKYLQRYQRIGIFGFPGVGKTTLLRKLLAEANRNGRFEKVILVSVQREDGERKIREDVLEWLNLKPSDSRDDVAAVANKISETLENMKYLLLLDHVYSEIDLDKVGIRRGHKYGKVVIASTLKGLCINKKEDSEFRVKRLEEKDAHTLFRHIVGEEVLKREAIKYVAELIVKQLCGLPRLIRAVARTLAKAKLESDWYRMKQQLQNLTELKIDDAKEVFNVLRLVYGELPVDVRRCLLYAALFPRDHEICVDYLVECWRAQGFIPDVQRNNATPFRVALDEGHHILETFSESSLLERCQRVKRIKMPEELRKLALEELYPKEQGCKVLVEEKEQNPADEQNEEQNEKHPLEEEWATAHRISLTHNRLRRLPRSPKCHELSTLLLQRNEKLEDIPNSFFDHMSKLQMLDLFKTEIEALPSSMFSLINLKGLYLNACCNLKVLSPKIAKLQNLEVLDIRCTGICSLPVEIGQLNNLKCFRFSFLCNSGDSPTLTTPNYNNILWFWKRKQQKEIIPPNLVKKLRKLEELTIMVDPKERTWNAIANDIAKEVASLKVLTNLCFHFPGVESLATFIKSRGDKIFRSYKVLVGYHGTDNRDGPNSSIDSAERLLRYSAGNSIPEEIKTVLKQATAFELIGHDSVQSLSDFGMENMKSVEVCVIEECNEMRTIVDGDNLVGTVSPALEELHVMNLQQLNCIWRGPVVPEVLANLRTLTLNGCPMLTIVLSNGITQHLQQLQCLRVENCSQITGIVDAAKHSQSNEIGEAENHEKNRSQSTHIGETENHSLITGSVDAENHSQSTKIGEAENHEENHSQSTRIGEAENHSRITGIVDAENHSQSTQIGEAENQEENHSQMTEVVEAKNHSHISKIVKAENHSGIAKFVEVKNQSQITEIAEAENHSHSTKNGAAENHSQMTEGFEVKNHSRNTEIVEAENNSKSTRFAEAENHSQSTEIVVAANHSQITEVIEAKYHSQNTEIVEAENDSKSTKFVEAGNHSQSTEVVEAKKHSQIAEKAEAENHSRITTKFVEAKQHSRIPEIVEAKNHSGITEIVEVDIILSGSLPKLETLELVNLPQLVSISQSDTLDWPCLEKIVIKRCPALRNLSLSTTNAPELKSISCNEQWWEILQQWLPDGLRQRIRPPLCQFSEENQPPDHGVAPHQKGHASSSMNNAAAGPSSSSSTSRAE